MPRRLAEIAGLVVLALVGAVAGALVAGRVQAEVGPFHTTVALRPSLSGDTSLRLAPLGTLRLDTHDGPFGLVATVDELDADAAQRVIEHPSALDEIDAEVAGDARDAVTGALARAGAGALVGAIAVIVLRRPGKRTVALATVTAVVAACVAAGWARATWNPRAMDEPTYTGLLAAAPRAIGSLEQVRRRYDAYRSQLTSLIGNVAELYNTTAGLTSFEPEPNTVRVLHVSDLHLNPQAFDVIDEVVRQFKVDVVVDTGDINDWGTPAEAEFVERIGAVPVPYVYVRGNHDSQATASAIAQQPNAVVLEGGGREVAGMRFWGIGDPRFTPDKSEAVGRSEERAVADRYAPTVARQARRAGDIDVAVVHDPRIAARLGGIAPLVLAGHLHQPSSRRLGNDTRLLVEGSTGGAGLRALEGDGAVPLSCSILYFDRTTNRLRALDRIRVAGLGHADVRIERHVFARDGDDATEPEPGGGP